MVRCEDFRRNRKDRAFPFVSTLSSVDGFNSKESGGMDHQLLRFNGEELIQICRDEGVLVPMARDSCTPGQAVAEDRAGLVHSEVRMWGCGSEPS